MASDYATDVLPWSERQDAAATLRDYHAEPLLEIANLTFTEEQVLQPWFPDEAP
jgi:hypothetical protein